MHEASIVLSLLDSLTNRCREEGYSSIESVKIRIGMASGIMPEAILFAFEASKQDTIACDAGLEIEMVPVAGSCSDCGREFEVNQAYVLDCPLCGSRSFKIMRGYELDIVEMEVN